MILLTLPFYYHIHVVQSIPPHIQLLNPDGTFEDPYFHSEALLTRRPLV
jgi:hypothetical protein